MSVIYTDHFQQVFAFPMIQPDFATSTSSEMKGFEEDGLFEWVTMPLYHVTYGFVIWCPSQEVAESRQWDLGAGNVSLGMYIWRQYLVLGHSFSLCFCHTRRKESVLCRISPHASSSPHHKNKTNNKSNQKRPPFKLIVSGILSQQWNLTNIHKNYILN